jgi:hypothetical protein
MERTSHKNKRAVKVVAVLFVTCILAFAGYTSIRDLSFRRRPFESSVWKQGDSRVHGEMVESLRGQFLLQAKTKEEVLALLGEPHDDRGALLDYEVDVGRRIAWRPFMLTLVIMFDDKMRVDSVEIVD